MTWNRPKLLLTCSLAVSVAVGVWCSQTHWGGIPPRKLSPLERERLRGAWDQTPFTNACCDPISNCEILPYPNPCSWYTVNGQLRCQRGMAQSSDYAGAADSSCTGLKLGTTCYQDTTTSACVVTFDCYWNYENGDCEEWEGSEQTYFSAPASCSPDCT